MRAWICRTCGGVPAGGEGLKACPEHPDQILIPLEEFERNGKHTWLGRLLGDRYGLFQFLGGGGFGQAFCALDMQLLRPVAVKIFHPADDSTAAPSMVARFYREARLLAQLNDPNIVTVHDLGVHDAVPYFAMEWVDGQPWGQALRGADPAVVLRLFDQVLSGLATAHAAGIIHRDIKPANIMVTADLQRAILIDFGIAKPEHETTPLTEAGMVLGTLMYMAPEIMKGQPASPRSDVYAVGTLLDAMVPRSAAPELRAVVTRATQTDPELRYQSAPALATDLRRVGARLDLPTTRLILDAPPAHDAPTIGAVASRIVQIRAEAAERAPVELRPRDTIALAEPVIGNDLPTRINTAEHTNLVVDAPVIEPPRRAWLAWAMVLGPVFVVALIAWIAWPSDTDRDAPRSTPSQAPVVATVNAGSAPSAAPITAAPSTAAPVTAAPVTAAPVTTAPVTAAPVTTAPVTTAPATAASKATRRASPRTAARRPKAPAKPATKVPGALVEEIVSLVESCRCPQAFAALRGKDYRNVDAWSRWIRDSCRAKISGVCKPRSHRRPL